MKNILLILLLTFASFAHAANTKIPASMLTGAPRFAGESYFAGTALCTWPRTNTVMGAFTLTAACPGPTVLDGTMGTWATTDSDLPRQTITSLPAGKYKAIFHVPTYSGATSENRMAIYDGTTVCVALAVDSGTTQSGSVVSCLFNYASAGTRAFELYGSSSSSTVNIYNIVGNNTKFQLEYWGNY